MKWLRVICGQTHRDSTDGLYACSGPGSEMSYLGLLPRNLVDSSWSVTVPAIGGWKDEPCWVFHDASKWCLQRDDIRLCRHDNCCEDCHESDGGVYVPVVVKVVVSDWHTGLLGYACYNPPPGIFNAAAFLRFFLALGTAVSGWLASI